MPFDPEAAFTAPQLTALVQGMLSTARIDGLHPKEESLIRAFYDAQREAGMADYAAVAAGAGSPLPAAVAGDAAFADQLVLMCLMAGYADGRLSDAERSHVAAIAQQAGIGEAKLAELQLQVKDSLIGSLAHLPDPESVAALAKTM
jgi:uncharacterized membrane protein YebE (DUF533 family)